MVSVGVGPGGRNPGPYVQQLLSAPITTANLLRPSYLFTSLLTSVRRGEVNAFANPSTAAAPGVRRGERGNQRGGWGDVAVVVVDIRNTKNVEAFEIIVFGESWAIIIRRLGAGDGVFAEFLTRGTVALHCSLFLC